MKPKIYLLFKVLLCFLLLYCLRDWVVVAYRSVLEPVGLLLLPIDAQDFKCGEICSLRIVAYLSLVFTTPHIGNFRRLFALLIGLTVFISIDLAGLYLWPTTQPFLAVTGETPYQLIYGFVWNVLGDLLLPFLLWIVLVDRHLGLFFAGATVEGSLERQRSFSRG
jgi:hypothetical protein